MSTAKAEQLDASPLRLRHPLQKREAATGFAARLAAVNGRNLGVLLRHRNLSPWDVDRGDPDAIRFVAAIGSADADQLLHQTIKQTEHDRRWQVVGESFGPNAINRTYFRYCPHCVLEDLDNVYGPPAARPWLRIEWTLTHFRSCNKHHTFLVAADPKRRRFQPFDFNETMAELFPELEAIAANAEFHRASAYHDWIVRRLEGIQDPANWLDSLPLHVGATWCENLGISALHPPKMLPTKLTNLDRAIASDEGFRIASSGKSSMLDLFERLNQTERRTRGIIGPRDTYGYAYRLLQQTMDDQAFEPLRKLMRDFAIRSMPWEPGTDILGEVVEDRALVTVRTTAVEAGVDAKTMRKIFKKKGLGERDLEDGLRNHRVIAPAHEVEFMVKKLKGALTLPATMRLLGIERRQVEALVDVGALPHAPGVDRDANGQFRFAREDIEAMMARLLDGAVEIKEPNDVQVDIATARHRAGATTEQVLRLILDRRVGWKGRFAGRTDYNAILLDSDEITLIVRTDAPQLDNLRYCDVPSVIPGLIQKSVGPLILLKKLDEIHEISPSARRAIPVVTRASAEAFHKKYVTAGELCSTQGLHHKQVKLLLGRAGVETAFDVKSVHAMIFDRAAVELAADAQADFWIRGKKSS